LPNHNYQDPGNTVEQVLKYLGYNVEIDYIWCKKMIINRYL
jgi:hypothetical protein